MRFKVEPTGRCKHLVGYDTFGIVDGLVFELLIMNERDRRSTQVPFPLLLFRFIFVLGSLFFGKSAHFQNLFSGSKFPFLENRCE